MLQASHPLADESALRVLSRTVASVSYFKSVSVGRFRGLRDARLEDLGRLNLVTGLNGCGKSALLEAMFLLAAPEKPELSLAVMALRGMERFALAEVDQAQTPWDSMFSIQDDLREVRLSAVMDSGLAVGVEMSTSDSGRPRLASPNKRVSRPSPAPPADARMRGIKWVSRRGTKNTTRHMFVEAGSTEVKVDPPSRMVTFQAALRVPQTAVKQEILAERFGQMELDGSTPILIQSLQMFDPRVKNVKTVYNRTGPFLHVDIGESRPLPITLMGGGFLALTEILVDMHLCSGGILLLDEIESGFHYSLMADVWRVISEASIEFDAQIVATTHSLEFIDNARPLLISEPNAFRLYRLERDHGTGASNVIDYVADELSSALELGLDVR